MMGPWTKGRAVEEERWEQTQYVVKKQKQSFFFLVFSEIYFKVITRIMTYNIIPEHIRFLEISHNV